MPFWLTLARSISLGAFCAAAPIYQVTDIGANHGKSGAQVSLRWQIQQVRDCARAKENCASSTHHHRQTHSGSGA